MTLIMTWEMADQLVVIVIAGMQFLLQNVWDNGKRKMSTKYKSSLSIYTSRSQSASYTFSQAFSATNFFSFFFLAACHRC